MKKGKHYLLVILLITIAFKGYSQVEKKTLLLGGYANIQYLSASENLYLNLNPNTGFFLSDKFCLGISLPVQYVSEQIYWGISPFARYYLKSKEPRSLYFSSAIGITGLFDFDNTFNSKALTLGVGHVWFLNKSVGFEAKFIGGTSNFHDDVDFGLFFGLQIYFNKGTGSKE